MNTAKRQSSPFGPELSPEGAPAIPLWIGGHAYLTMPAGGFFDLRGTDDIEVLRRVPLCGADAVEAAVGAARRALSVPWQCDARDAVRMQLAGLAQRFADHLAGLLRSECGPDFAASSEVAAFTARLAPTLVPEDPMPTAQPTVLAVIGLADAPLAAIAAAALAALERGDAVILKPSVRCPSAALAFAEMATRAGLPDGRLNVVHGDDAVIEALCRHPQVGAVTCAGSGDAAAAVAARARAAGKPLVRSET